MKKDKTLKIGIVGTIIAALCCFTPVLVILFSAIGLSSIIGLLDFVLIPTFLIFLSLTVFALWKRQNRTS